MEVFWRQGWPHQSLEVLGKLSGSWGFLSQADIMSTSLSLANLLILICSGVNPPPPTFPPYEGEEVLASSCLSLIWAFFFFLISHSNWRKLTQDQRRERRESLPLNSTCILTSWIHPTWVIAEACQSCSASSHWAPWLSGIVLSQFLGQSDGSALSCPSRGLTWTMETQGWQPESSSFSRKPRRCPKG